MDKSRFSGVRSGAIHVDPFILPLLDSCDMGNAESGETFEQKEPRLIYPAILESMPKSKSCT